MFPLIVNQILRALGQKSLPDDVAEKAKNEHDLFRKIERKGTVVEEIQSDRKVREAPKCHLLLNLVSDGMIIQGGFNKLKIYLFSSPSCNHVYLGWDLNTGRSSLGISDDLLKGRIEKVLPMDLLRRILVGVPEIVEQLRQSSPDEIMLVCSILGLNCRSISRADKGRTFRITISRAHQENGRTKPNTVITLCVQDRGWVTVTQENGKSERFFLKKEDLPIRCNMTLPMLWGTTKKRRTGDARFKHLSLDGIIREIVEIS